MPYADKAANAMIGFGQWANSGLGITPEMMAQWGDSAGYEAGESMVKRLDATISDTYDDKSKLSELMKAETQGDVAGEAAAKAFAEAQKAWLEKNAAYYQAGFMQVGRKYDAAGNVIEEGKWTNKTEGCRGRTSPYQALAPRIGF